MMFKYQKVVHKSSLKKALVLWRPLRAQSTGKSKESNLTSNLILGAAAVTGITTVGLVGYVTWSTRNRQKVEASLPVSRYIFNLLLGPLPQLNAPSITVSSSTMGSLQQNKIERDQNKGVHEDEKVITEEIKPPNIEEMPTLPNINVTDDTTEIIILPPIEDDLNKIDDVEAEQSLSSKLSSLIEISRQQCLEAESAVEDITKAIHKYVERAYHAIGNIEGQGQDELSLIASEVHNLKDGELLMVVQEKLTNAKQTVENLRNVIEEGWKDKNMEHDTILTNANEVVRELSSEVTKVTSLVSEAIRDCLVVGDLRHVMEVAKREFQVQVKSLLPDLKLSDQAESLTEEEIKFFLNYAHKKIPLIQDTLTQKQVDKDKKTDTESSIDYEVNHTNMKAKLDQQKLELYTLHRHRMAELRQELESQLHLQLKQQTAAHSDHLTDALRLQQSELDRRWKNMVYDAVQQKQTEYYTALSSIDGQLEGLKEGISLRSKVIDEAVNAQTLWVACEVLRSTLRLSKGHTWEEKLEPLKENVDAIRRAAGSGNEFVETVLNTLSKDSLTRGVYTEEALRERFIKVEKICRRVSIIGDNGGSLVKYFISYLQSFLLADTYQLLTMADMHDEEIDITKLTTFDILARTKYCIEKDDFLQSIKYMKLLQGEPRNVASDWLREALLTMEARQAADSLMAFAAAIVGKAL